MKHLSKISRMPKVSEFQSKELLHHVDLGLLSRMYRLLLKLFLKD